MSIISALEKKYRKLRRKSLQTSFAWFLMSSSEPPVGGSGGELPPGWSEHQSKSNQGKTYYFNRRTGERLWDRAKVKPGLKVKFSYFCLAVFD